MSRSCELRLVILGILLSLSPSLAWAQAQAEKHAQAQTKLYLKDGSYQLIQGYQIEGDRVRYYSVERSEWEEIPRSLVDFDATRRGEEQEKQAQHHELEEARKLQSERLIAPPSQGYQITPGFRLPGDEGVFAFDGTRVIRLAQSNGELVRDKKRMALLMAMPGPILKSREIVVIAGAKAANRMTDPRPQFYIQSNDIKPDAIQLLPLRATRQSRVVEKIQGGIGVGKSGEIRTTIPLTRATVAPGIYKLVPVQPLEPGEYALGELLEDHKLNLDVWDFGIDGPRHESPP